MKTGWINIDSFLAAYKSGELLVNYLKVNKISTIEEHEIDCFYAFSKHLSPLLNNKQKFGYLLDQESGDNFKEQFDVLRFANGSVLNIELKSSMPDGGRDEIFDQLDRHTYLLGTLGKIVYAFTFVLDSKQIFRIAEGELVVSSFDDIAKCIENDYIEENALESMDSTSILISPYSEPNKFVESRYFLNQQQKPIRDEILKCQSGKFCISGGAGTGKSLVLFDLAKKFKKSKSVLFIFVASISDTKKLSNLYGFVFKSISEIEITDVNYLNKFDVILIDEAQRLTKKQYDGLIQSMATIIFSVDRAQTLKPAEKNTDIEALLKENPSVKTFNLKTRVRTDEALSTFIKKLFNLKERKIQPMEFPKVNVVYYDDYAMAKDFIIDCKDVEDYHCIEIADYTTVSSGKKKREQIFPNSKNGFSVIGREYNNVLIPIDDRIGYNEDARLIATTKEFYPYLATNNLFEGITRVKQNLLFVVINNPKMFKIIPEIVTWYRDQEPN